ncbi:MAG: hypothetical protein ABIJ16_04985 [Bacteroidota bacterium]
MANYRFNIVTGRPSVEDVRKYRDFNKLIYNYQLATRPITGKPLYNIKYKRIFLAVLLIILILWLLLSEAMQEEKQQAPDLPATGQESPDRNPMPDQ